MFFYAKNENIIRAYFIFDRDDDKATLVSAYTTFDKNFSTKELSIDCINKYLDIILYEVNSNIIRVAFYKNKFYELFKDKIKDNVKTFDIPLIINIGIIYGKNLNYSKMQYKIRGFTDRDLMIEPITKDEYFAEIKKPGGYELIEKYDLDKRLKEIKSTEDYFEKLREGE